MSVQTRQQRLAEAAFAAVRTSREDRSLSIDEYNSFAKSFPALIVTAGLCQTIAFAESKGGAKLRVYEDMLEALHFGTPPAAGVFAQHVRQAPVSQYLQLSRTALEAATWVKRYVEAQEKSR